VADGNDYRYVSDMAFHHPTKWEYCVCDDNQSPNDLGQEGWELVSVYFDGRYPIWIFKRPLN
jgi:hypothetical protein